MARIESETALQPRRPGQALLAAQADARAEPVRAVDGQLQVWIMENGAESVYAQADQGDRQDGESVSRSRHPEADRDATTGLYDARSTEGWVREQERSIA